jgi:ATP-dependent DNA ligase
MMVMLCNVTTYEQAKHLLVEGGWVFEPKFDGVRAYIKGGRLYDRNDRDITERFPEFIGIESIDKTLDGEIIQLDAEKLIGILVIGVEEIAGADFDAVNSRMHMKSNFKLMARLMPCVFVAFDCIGEDRHEVRRGDLLTEVVKLQWGLSVETGLVEFRMSWLQMTKMYSKSSFEKIWDSVKRLNTEGVVLKRSDGLYVHGRSENCLKLKNWHEEIAVFTILNEHSRGVRLETADGRSVNVNGVIAEDVKSEFCKNGCVTCEIQFLQQKNGVWRMPVFKRMLGEV